MFVRSFVAVALAAILGAPLAASAQTRTTVDTTAAPRSLSIGGWIGYESGDLDGLALRFEGEFPFQQLSPELALSFVGSVGYSRLSDESFGIDVTSDILKLVPTARFTFAASPQLSLFGDAGVGLYYHSTSVDAGPFFGEGDESGLGAMLRFGLGAFYQLNPQLRLGGALVLDPMFGDYDDNTFTVQIGISYQL